MNNRLWMLALMAALLVGAAGAAYAVPSLGGPTGIVALPTTDIAGMRDLETAATYQPLEIASPTGADDARAWSLQVLRGVSDEAELWGAYSRVTDGSDSDLWRLGGKYKMKGFWGEDVQFVVGGSIARWIDGFGLPWVHAVGMYTSDVDVKKFYAVASRELTPIAPGWQRGPRGTRVIANVGLLYMSIDPDEGGAESSARPFVAVEIKEGDSVIGLEYRMKDNDLDNKAVFSAVLRRPGGNNFFWEIGTTNASPIGLGMEDQEFFARICFDLPMETGYY
jgi:hypothetical protein